MTRHSIEGWGLKKEREGEADNPGPPHETCDDRSDGQPEFDENDESDCHSDDDLPPALFESDSEEDHNNNHDTEEDSGSEDDEGLMTLAVLRKKMMERQASKEEGKQANYKFMTNNVYALMPSVAAVAAWDADALMLQETRLGEILQMKVAGKCAKKVGRVFRGGLWKQKEQPNTQHQQQAQPGVASASTSRRGSRRRKAQRLWIRLS